MKSTLAAAVMIAATVPGASAATKVSDYQLTGALTMWVEPKPTDAGEPWRGCAVEFPKLSFRSVIDNKRPRLHLTALFPYPGGIQWPLNGPITFLFPERTFALWGGEEQITGVEAFGLDDYRTVPQIPAALASSGRASLLSSVYYNQRWGGINVPVIQSLPTRSVPFKKLPKPAGSCATAGGGTSLYFS